MSTIKNSFTSPLEHIDENLAHNSHDNINQSINQTINQSFNQSQLFVTRHVIEKKNLSLLRTS